MNRIRQGRAIADRRRTTVAGTFDLTHTLHVGGIQVRCDDGLVEIHLPNGTEITLQPAAETLFCVLPAAAEPVSIRPDDGRDEQPLVRTGPGGDFCRDWPCSAPEAGAAQGEPRSAAVAVGGAALRSSPSANEAGEGA